MRCSKCQYLGFEPSPRCKNCGYDFSLGVEPDAVDLVDVIETAPALEADARRSSEFDLHIFDDFSSTPSTPMTPAPAGGFDLDELLATGRAGDAPVERLPEAPPTAPMMPPPSPAPPVVSAPVLSTSTAHARKRVQSASAVVTPPPAEVSKIVAASMTPVRNLASARPTAAEPVVRAAIPAVPEPPAPAGTNMDLPLFMQGMSDVRSAPVIDTVDFSTPTLVDPAQVTDQADQINKIDEIDDRPLVQVPATPRAPLAVRRTTPDPSKLRAKYARASVDSRDLLADIDTPPAKPMNPMAAVAPEAAFDFEEVRVPMPERLSAEPTPQSLPAGWLQNVGASKRLTAAGLDVLLIGAFNAAIVWFTLNVCGLAPADAHLLPIVPLALFFLLLDGSYLVLFTAACGQTIGKMVAGIRVVGTTTGAIINDRVTVTQALMRTCGSIVSCLPLGAGLVVGLVGDGRAVHDRLAHTRVVRA